ncbi:hypothetical protein ACCO45_011044 [Purpureocillium lilacinum]|uniref:Uncharacterized protein n=1 Tax=Purpureocillium lilacinum TaxID=33203 RepID=A0ACC4DJ64_PURLI
MGYKDKSSRLAAFVRGSSDSGIATATAPASTAPANPNVEAPDEKHPSTPRRRPSAQSRQQLADAVKMPIPIHPRNPAPVLHEPKAEAGQGSSSPHDAICCRPLLSPPVPRDSDSNHGDIFSGSQLGDNFMNSGLSTPQNEPDNLDEEVTPTAKRREQTVEIPLEDLARHSLVQRSSSFVVNEEGRPGTPSIIAFQSCLTPNHGSAGTSEKAPAPGLPPKIIEEADEEHSPVTSEESASWPEQRTRDHHRSRPYDHGWDDNHELQNNFGSPPQSIPEPKVTQEPTRRPSVAPPMQPRLPQQHHSRDRKRRQPSAEYDDNMLSSMTYKDLQDEPFDGGDARPNGLNGRELAAKLPSKLAQYRHLSDREQSQMFASLSMEDWETAGDWFVDQFTNIMQRLKQARRDKRRLIRDFENEAAVREEAVRLRSDTIDRQLAKMRQDGLRVVQDKIT